jgi:glutamate racemase
MGRLFLNNYYKVSNTVIGIFDSGVGGLSVWKELVRILPNVSFVYASDNAYCPYGTKSQDDVIFHTKAITEFLISKGALLIVVACNTATAAAISTLRKDYDIPFIGMEPAVKPAALHSKSGVIGVLATQGTLRGKQYNTTLETYASDIKVIGQVGTGLVELVEAGDIHGSKTKELLKKYIDPMILEKADHIVLGCTHYPFLREEIQKIAGDNVIIVDPAPAVALHTYNTLAKNNLIFGDKIEPSRQTIFYSSGPIDSLVNMAHSILPSIPNELFIKNRF